MKYVRFALYYITQYVNLFSSVYLIALSSFWGDVLLDLESDNVRFFRRSLSLYFLFGDLDRERYRCFLLWDSFPMIYPDSNPNYQKYSGLFSCFQETLYRRHCVTDRKVVAAVIGFQQNKLEANSSCRKKHGFGSVCEISMQRLVFSSRSFILYLIMRKKINVRWLYNLKFAS